MFLVRDACPPLSACKGSWRVGHRRPLPRLLHRPESQTRSPCPSVLPGDEVSISFGSFGLADTAHPSCTDTAPAGPRTVQASAPYRNRRRTLRPGVTHRLGSHPDLSNARQYTPSRARAVSPGVTSTAGSSSARKTVLDEAAGPPVDPASPRGAAKPALMRSRTAYSAQPLPCCASGAGLGKFAFGCSSPTWTDRSTSDPRLIGVLRP